MSHWLSATEILKMCRPQLLHDHVPLAVVGDRNCPLRSISRALYGHEEHHILFRLPTALEIGENRSSYDTTKTDYNDLINDSRIDPLSYQNIMKISCGLGIHWDAVSTVIGSPLVTQQPFPYELLAAWTRRVCGRGVADQPTTIKIMWSSMMVPERPSKFAPNHFAVMHAMENPYVVRHTYFTGMVVNGQFYPHQPKKPSRKPNRLKRRLPKHKPVTPTHVIDLTGSHLTGRKGYK